VPDIEVRQGSTNRRIEIQDSPGIKQDNISKINEKSTSGVAQVVEYLPSKGEALSSTPNMARKKKKAFMVSLGLFICYIIYAMPDNAQIVFKDEFFTSLQPLVRSFYIYLQYTTSQRD
jgi:hypothetical protein